MRAGPLFLAFVAAGAVSLVAQAPQPPTFRSGVKLVRVDVVVLDKTGHPLRGLTRDDFELLDDGEPRNIATLSEVAHDHHPEHVFPDTISLDVADNQSARSDRLVVLVMDDNRTSKEHLEDARRLAREIVAQLGAQASLALVTTSGRVGVEVTEDRSLVLHALERVSSNEPQRAARAPATPAHSNAPYTITDGGPSGPAGDLQSFFNDQDILRTMRDVAKAIGSADDRRKALIWISHGVPAELDPAAASFASMGGQVTKDDYYATSAARLLSALHAANVATYAVDPAGARALGELGFVDQPDLAPGPIQDRDIGTIEKRSLQYISEQSGGFAITGRDFKGGLLRLVNDLDHYYMLGFYPEDASHKGYRPITVRVKRPDASVRYRRGYRVEDTDAAGRRKDSLASGILPKPDLPLRLFAMPLPGAQHELPVALTIEVTSPLAPLSDAAGHVADVVKYGVTAVDVDKKKEVSYVSREARLSLHARSPGAGSSDRLTYEIVTGVKLPPGRYQLRVGVISERAGVGGSVYLMTDVPGGSKAPLIVTGPAIRSTTRPAIPAAGDAGDRPGSLVPFAPDLDRTFARGDEIQLFCAVAHRAPSVSATTALVGQDGQAAWRHVDTVEGPGLSTKIPLAGVPPGAYELRITVTDGEHSAERSIGLIVQ